MYATFKLTFKFYITTQEYTHMCSSRKYNFYYQDPITSADVRISFCKNQHFLAKIVPLLKPLVWELCSRHVFKIKDCCFRKYKPFVQNPASRLLQSNHKLENYDNVNLSTQRLCSFFLTLSYFSCQVKLMFQVSGQYHVWFWSYHNFFV